MNYGSRLKGFTTSNGLAASRNSGDIKRYFGNSIANTHPLSEFSNMCEKHHYHYACRRMLGDCTQRLPLL